MNYLQMQKEVKEVLIYCCIDRSRGESGKVSYRCVGSSLCGKI